MIMAEAQPTGVLIARDYRMQPRIKLRSVDSAADLNAASLESSGGQILSRDEDCSKGANYCEKPVGNTNTLPIVLGIVIPLVLALGLIYFFHRRGAKRREREEAADPNQDLDFGIEGGPPSKKSKRKSGLKDMMSMDPRHRAQISMDMNLSSPYFLPPSMQDSKESLHSIARQFNNESDPYRTVKDFNGSDVGSINEKSGASMYAKSVDRRDTSRSRNLPPRGNSLHSLPPRQNSLPMPPPPAADPFGTPTSGAMTPQAPSTPTQFPGQSPQGIVPEIGTVDYPPADYNGLDRSLPPHPQVQEPPQVAQRNSLTSRGSRGSRPSWGENKAYDDRSLQSPNTPGTIPEVGVGLGLNEMTFPNPGANHGSPNQNASQPPLPTIVPEEGIAYGDYYDQGYNEAEEERGRSAERRSMEGQTQNVGALGVPQQDNKRLSVGLRPLPPDEMIESEDPEERANRIRSFYKEYFDDIIKPDTNAPPAGDAGGAGYYEDYDASYLGADSAYYDPTSNTFVMPYAQPVQRRAMTPPPGGSRLRGPPPPRAMHGSMGAGRRGPPRGPPRPGSASSSQYGQMRPGSSVSNRYQRQPKPRGPPPAALNTLPNPSKLKDDSIALLGAIDFAPPDSYEDRNRGRSQSPSGERRPYNKPKVPVASPLVSSFDEMASIPSPHLLRKSSTFTGLDFAPPRKFANEDSMSDAGSIRSNKSGLSAMHAHAIRTGAGRVSRLPDDTVFTAAKLESTLKPSWNMRDGM